MEKITLKLSEFYQLDAELNGIVNPSTGEKLSKGLLSEKVKLTTKYWLTDLSKKTIVEKEAIELVKNDLIKKYGETDEQGNISIPFYTNIVKDEEGNTVSQEFNPKMNEFQDEFNALLEETKELEYKPISLNELENIESNNNYPVFFQLVKVNA